MAGDKRRPRSAVGERIRRAVERTFVGLERLSYLKDEDRREFRYYERSFLQSLDGIDRKIRSGAISPLDLTGFPRDATFPGYEINAGLFIGSFDPFQMTHLAMALRFLAAPESAVDVLFVVPEGSFNPTKPRKSDYRFRFEVLSLQLRGVFSPLVVPLDIGADAGTVQIVERFIALFPGATMNLTHVLGSDTLPYAVRLLPSDLEAWNAAALRTGVRLSFRMFVVKRNTGARLGPLLRMIRARGVPVSMDRRMIGMPSSTDFRENRAFTIIFPTQAILRRVEILFRYGMNRPWVGAGGATEPEDPASSPSASGAVPDGVPAHDSDYEI